MDYVVLESLPISENIPTDSNWLDKNYNKTLLAYLNQLGRVFPEYKSRLVFRDLSMTEEYRYSLVMEFDNEIQFEEAKYVADHQPYCWDEKAREELGPNYFKEVRTLICTKDENQNILK